ncbi:MAG: cupin domain-containing protein [Candidatus Heimdallarchaeota archaeon]|nr:cupin domain-containing protein [Candidatus Heimdallarchaeota archaeon]MCK4254073.1 cupin domain-containing protein [Candidatus Heimdallarchaeota archaeon]
MQIIRRGDYTSIKGNYSECMERCKSLFPGISPFVISKVILLPRDPLFRFSLRGVKDVVFIIEGEVEIEKVDKREKEKVLLKEGDLAIFDAEMFYTLVNHSEKSVETIRITFLEKK